ncbi:MAG: class I SAM-dependent methyltransferase [Bacteroidetes bacterium]|nr:class I SAM-dependent methyltransferase [Bacteroidota bacterium]MCW5894522.1 class I SAM-dependent methyltransferase [Bacteroidota bacterium]
MTEQTLLATGRAYDTSLTLLHELLGEYPARDFDVRFWNGMVWEAEPDQPRRFTLVLQHPGALRSMFLPPTELSLAEAYIYNDFDIEGDISAVFPLADHFMSIRRSFAEKLHFGKLLHSLPSSPRGQPGRRAAVLDGRLHSPQRDFDAVTYHYNTSNQFFRLFLDAQMVYSCAYFETLHDNLDTAQTRKLDYVCRKLRLRPGERLLDIGCGWGGLIIHAAKKYRAKCVGITLSRLQAEFARERIRQAGLEDRCRVEMCDYRDIDAPSSFDKLASIGMLEHVGEKLLPTYFEQAWRLLRPGGVFLNHGIARNATEPLPEEPTFSDRYVFPDGELVPLHTTLHAAEKSGFEVRDVESLREHYAVTLRNWVRRLEAHCTEAVAATDETTYRVWRLYMSGSAYWFWRGKLNVYQSLLVKSVDGVSNFPLTRNDWYVQ